MVKYFQFLIIVIFALIFLPTRSLAQEYFFQDDFSASNLDNTKWQAYPNDGTISVGNDVVWLRSGHTKTFPFVYSKTNPFPASGDFSVEFKLQYTEVTYWGTGVVLSSETPVNGQNIPSNPIFQAWIWDDTSTGNNGFRIDFKDSSQLHPVYSKSPIDLNPHVIKLDYIEGIYKIYLDGSLIYTSSQTTNKPNVIWFGNPVNTGAIPNWNWTAFKLDYIRVKSLTPAKTPLILIPGIAASSNWGVLTDKGDIGWRWMTTAESGWRQFIDSLEKAGYQKDKDYFIAFYDWRKTNDWTDSDPGAALPAKKYLVETIDKAKAANPGLNKVNVVAHSMGGLVARSYVESPNYRGDIDKAFLIGSPNAGSPFAYYTWEGAEISPNWDPSSKAALNMMIKFLSFNFLEGPYQMIHDHIKSIKDLLPIGYDYLINNNHPFNWINMHEINNFLKNTSNSQNTSGIFATKGVQLFNITGTGQNTWEKLQIENFVDPYLWKDGKPKGAAGTSDGDNTVLTSSSFLPGTEQITIPGKHANLPNAVTSQIFSKLGISYTPSYLAGAPDEVMVAWVASPVTLSVQDSQGNLVGQSLIDPTGEMKWVFVENPSGDYKINLTGTGSGDYHVGVDYYTASRTDGAVGQGTAEPGVNLNYNLNFNPQDPQPLQLVPVDNIPPTTIANLNGTAGQNDWFWSDVRLTLTATDNENGVGIKEIKYSFNNLTWQAYTHPLTINTEGITAIYYYSSDLVGNKEEVKKINIKVDKTPPEASFSFNPDKKEIETLGKDSHSGIDTISEQNGVITITDKAGHSLKLQVKEKEKPRRDKISIESIESISYDNQPPTKLEDNKLKVEFSWDKKDNILRELEQQIKIKGDIKMTAHYNQQKNQTQVITKEKGQDKQKLNLNGLILLKLNTNQGNLEANY